MEQTQNFRPKTKLILVLITLLFLGAASAVLARRIFAKNNPSRSQQLSPLSKIFRDGDLVFQTSLSSQSQAIQVVTKSIYSHMGIVLIRQGQPYVLEAIQPVKWTPLVEWVARGKNGHVVVKRLRDAERILTQGIIEKMNTLSKVYIGRSYDNLFQWSDQRMYCSELVYKIYERAVGIPIGRLQKIEELKSLDTKIQKKLIERFHQAGTVFDSKEQIITPQSMFEDPKLIMVFEN